MGQWHAEWFAKKGPGRSWRLRSQPPQGSVPGGSRAACAGMLFLSGDLEQEQRRFRASDAELLPCQKSSCLGHGALWWAGTDQGSQ